MKTLSTLLLFLSFAFIAQAQESETRNHTNFQEIAVGIPAKVYVKQGAFSVKLEGEELEAIETYVKGDRLQIRKEKDGKWFNWSWGDDEPIVIYISLPKLTGLHLSGSGKLIGQSKFTTDQLDIHVSGSGSVELDVDAKLIETHVSGSGSIRLSGEANSLDAHISGSGKTRSQDLKTRRADVHISGSGSCYVDASESLDARISGSGSVYYQETPQKLNVKTSGSGKARKM